MHRRAVQYPTVLRAALDVAVRHGLVQRSVAAVIKRPLADRPEAAYLTSEQADGLVTAPRQAILHDHARQGA